MGVTVLINPQIVINSVDLTNRIDTVTLEETFADVDTTAFGSSSKTRVAGLGDHKVTLNFQQDFAAASVEATVYPLIGTTTSITVKPLNAATSTVNPAYTFTVLVTDWKPVDGKVGALLTSSISWPVTGAVAKAFS
ncbi:MAG: hypothetical protein JWO62_2572 [Acidimicrobiaceae bacterium]|nr:hypothetical protein [Acidimicrobiaceae bacterium]